MKKVLVLLAAVVGLLAFVACENPNSPGGNTEYSNTTWYKVVKNNGDSVLYTAYIKFGRGSTGVFTAEPTDLTETVKPDNFTYTITNDTLYFTHEKYTYYHYYRWKLSRALPKVENGVTYLMVYYQYYLNGQWIERIDDFEKY